MGQYCFAHWRLSSSSVTLPAGRPGSGHRRARGQLGGRHCTAGQYGYIPLGRHLVEIPVGSSLMGALITREVEEFVTFNK